LFFDYYDTKGANYSAQAARADDQGGSGRGAEADRVPKVFLWMMDNDSAWRMILEQIEREIALWGGYSLLQGNQGLKLTQDSALLSDFVRLKPGERGLELGTGQGGLYV
jgi:hypothetical protein